MGWARTQADVVLIDTPPFDVGRAQPSSWPGSTGSWWSSVRSDEHRVRGSRGRGAASAGGSGHWTRPRGERRERHRYGSYYYYYSTRARTPAAPAVLPSAGKPEQEVAIPDAPTDSPDSASVPYFDVSEQEATTKLAAAREGGRPAGLLLATLVGTGATCCYRDGTSHRQSLRRCLVGIHQVDQWPS